LPAVGILADNVSSWRMGLELTVPSSLGQIVHEHLAIVRGNNVLGVPVLVGAEILVSGRARGLPHPRRLSICTIEADSNSRISKEGTQVVDVIVGNSIGDVWQPVSSILTNDSSHCPCLSLKLVVDLVLICLNEMSRDGREIVQLSGAKCLSLHSGSSRRGRIEWRRPGMEGTRTRMQNREETHTRSC